MESFLVCCFLRSGGAPKSTNACALSSGVDVAVVVVSGCCSIPLLQTGSTFCVKLVIWMLTDLAKELAGLAYKSYTRYYLITTLGSVGYWYFSNRIGSIKNCGRFICLIAK